MAIIKNRLRNSKAAVSKTRDKKLSNKKWIKPRIKSKLINVQHKMKEKSKTIPKYQTSEGLNDEKSKVSIKSCEVFNEIKKKIVEKLAEKKINAVSSPSHSGEIKKKSIFSEKKKSIKKPKKIRLKHRVYYLNDYGEHDGTDVSTKKVQEAVQVVLKLLGKEKQDIFGEEKSIIQLQVTCVFIPKVPTVFRVFLPHSLLPESPDICLFTRDLQKGKTVSHEPTLEHMKAVLEKAGVTEIKEVIPLRQLKVEYDQFELKRALCNRFDLFLSDGKVSGLILHQLGKTFSKRKKFPIPIKLDSKNLKKQVQTAVHQTSCSINGSGKNFYIKVGHNLMSPDQIQENIESAIAAVRNNSPGGWGNISHLKLKGVATLGVPIYVSMMDKSAVKRFTPRLGKHMRPVWGPLEGVGVVKVKRDGNVVIMEKEEPDKFELEAERNFEEMRENSRKRRNRKKVMLYDSDDELNEEEKEEEEIDNGSRVVGNDANRAANEDVENEEEDENEVVGVKHENEEHNGSDTDSDCGNETSKQKGKKKKIKLTSFESEYLEEWEKSKNIQVKKSDQEIKKNSRKRTKERNENESRAISNVDADSNAVGINVDDTSRQKKKKKDLGLRLHETGYLKKQNKSKNFKKKKEEKRR